MPPADRPAETDERHAAADAAAPSGQHTPHRWRTLVFLRHTPTGADPHVDLLLAPLCDHAEPPGPEERCLLTWRLEGQPPLDAGASFTGVRLADHRFLYLDFQGDMTHGRGTIERLASGRAALRGEPHDGVDLHLVVELGERRALLHARRVGDAPDAADDSTPPRGLWRFDVLDAHTASGSSRVELTSGADRGESG